MADTNIDFSTKYSLSSLLNNLLRINQNSLEILNKLSNITTTDADMVEIDVLDSNNQVSKIYVPSYGQIKADINRIDNNIKQISGIGDSNANVQLEDGSFRKLIQSNLMIEGNTLTQMNLPTTFESKTNWFFESFLNPLLYVSFNFTGQIPSDTERCKVQRFILNITTPLQLNVWNNSINKKSNLDYVTFFQLLLANNITYFLDEDVVDMPPRDLRYYGAFIANRVFDDDVITLVDGVSTSKRKFRIQLNTVNYNDSTSEYSKTQQLKIGDSIVIVTEGTQKNTRYQITNIDLDNGNVVELKLLEGFDTIAIGTKFQFYSADITATNLDLNIGFNEYNVVFVKPINPVSKIPALEWSPGAAFYTNGLEIIDEAGNKITLEEYYKDQVVDFGVFLYNMAKDGIPPATLAETPLKPTVSATDFKVAQINNHITDVAIISTIKSLQSEKIKLAGELDSLNSSIKKKKAEMNTKRYTSQPQRDTDQAELNDLINRSSSASTLLKSSVDEILSLSDSGNLGAVSPKFRIKGFWPMPDQVAAARTGPQSVIQFRVAYRYITKDGGANQPQQIGFKDNTGVERRGTFSSWEEFLTPVRKRSKNATTGNYEWDIENVENADVVNINQLEIPIRQGEGVEIKIKSISEAGWPANPAESAWCDIVKVDFPDELISSNEISTIIEQSKIASESLELTATLADTGVTEHISEQFTQNESFYAHPSGSIASGFLTDEQNVINLFEKLSDFETRIKQIEEAITGEKGILGVTILDSKQREYRVKKNTLVQLFAGNYRDQVQSLTLPKGAIMSKTYLLQLTNINATPLELYSREFGNYTKVVNSTTPLGTGFNANEIDYNTARRYDVVPLGPSNPSTDDTLTYSQFRNLPLQSSQVKGQFINTRYQTVDGTSNLYEDITTSIGGTPAATLAVSATNNFPIPSIATPLTNYTQHEYTLSSEYDAGGALPANTGNVAGDFIWSGIMNGGVAETVNTSVVSGIVGGWNDGIYVHNIHPSITDGDWGTVGATQGIGSTGAAGPTGVRNSGFAPLASTDLTGGGRKQAAYFWYDTLVGPTAAKVSKMSYSSYDQYLLGPNSCGAYLFLSPTNLSGAINVSGANQLSTRTLDFGNQHTLNIPLVYQYRMTDFFGDNTNGLGNIGGDPTGTVNQVEYTKRLGIDIYSNIDERYSFDVEITARYRSVSLQMEEVPSTSLTNVVDDLTRTVRVLNPKISGVSAESSTNSNNSGNLLGSI